MAAGIADELPSAAVTINAEKPRKGVFEVRVGGTVVVSTGPEPRPFPLLKAIDVSAVAQEAAAQASDLGA